MRAEETLARIGADETPRLLVLNKIDRVEDDIALNELACGREPACRLSALHGGAGIADLAANVDRFIAAQQVETAFEVPAGAGRFLAYLEERGTVLDRQYVDGSVNVRVLLSPADRARALRMAADEVAGAS